MKSVLSILHRPPCMKTPAADRLSELPDCILEEILSLLTSRQAVQTSVQSRRWRRVWRTVPSRCIDIDPLESRAYLEAIKSPDEFEGVESYMHALKEKRRWQMNLWNEFERFADRLTMPQQETSRPPLDRFRLRVSCQDFTAARRWIWRGLELRPAEFHLCCDSEHPYASFNERYPCFPDLILEPHAGVYTCRLRTLHLSGLSLSSDFMHAFTSGSPVLEDIHLEDCECRFQRVASHTLKNLSMDCCSHGFGPGDTLVLALPRLVSLRINGCPPPVTAEAEMPSLVSASMARSAGDLGVLCSIRDVRSLELSRFPVTALLHDEAHQGVPVFRNLRTLVLDECELGVECQVLRRFLRDAPSLETLTLHDCTSEGGSRSKKRKRTTSKHDGHGPTTIAYPCKNLTSIELEFIDGHAVVDLANALGDIAKEVVYPIESSVHEGKRRVKISYK